MATTATASRVVRLDNEQIRVLAHPLRSRLLGLLRLDGPSTATALAAVVGTNSGATSYHLRSLARVGLVIEDQGHPSARERWWRAAHEISQYLGSDFSDDPDAAAAADWLASRSLELLSTQFQAWLAARDRFSAAWREAASVNDEPLWLSPAQLAELTSDISALVDRYRDAERSPEAEQVLVGYLAFPRPRP
jgi:DNA-binding transcriptional ArsR family regulator